MKSILIIEDDENIIELLEIHLKDIHCEVTKATTGKNGMLHAMKKPFDLIILDVMLPDMDGMEICKKLRAENNASPILMLTARSEEIDKVIGLESGADDYLTKPFSIRELIARVKAILRREEINHTTRTNGNRIVSAGEITVDADKRKVLVKGTKIDLTQREFDLLYLFISNPGKSYSREALLNAVWGYEFNGYEHTVNSHISRLRAKIESDMSKPNYILTTWGIGYRFNDEMQAIDEKG